MPKMEQTKIYLLFVTLSSLKLTLSSAVTNHELAPELEKGHINISAFVDKLEGGHNHDY